MAPLTLAAILSEVNVILLVTRQAVLIEFDLAGGMLVAPVTGELSMCACEREASLFAVVELPNLPAIRGVAFRTLGSERAFVSVVPFMARDAITADVTIFTRGVTLFAGHRNVQSQ
jgi:hypothetical protein